MRIYVSNDEYNEAHRVDAFYCEGLQQVIDVHPTATISSLKATVQRLFSITDEDMGRRMLVHGGRDLFDEEYGTAASSTLDQCGVKDWASLEVGIRGRFLISAYVLPLGTHVFEVSPYDTNGDVKERILERHALGFGHSRSEDDDDDDSSDDDDDHPALVATYELEVSPFDNDTLISDGIFKKIPGTTILGPFHYGEAINAGKSDSSTGVGLSSLDDPFDVPNHYSATRLQIVLDIPTTPLRFPLQFEPTDTVGMVRQDIQLNKHDGLFVLVCDRKQLQDDSITLDECGIKNMDYIHVLEKASFEIVISSPEHGLDIRVEVECSDSIGMLKGKIHVMTGILPERQRLIYHEWFLDDDERWLVEYGIAFGLLGFTFFGKLPSRIHKKEEFHIFLFASSNGSESGRSIETKAGLSLENFEKIVLYGSYPHATFGDDDCSSATANCYSATKLQIAVKIPNMPWRFPLMCKPTDTIGTVREEIRQKCYSRYDELLGQRYIEKGQFVLAFNRKQLMDESITLDECGIKHMDSVEILEETSIPILVDVPERRLRTLVYIKCFDTIRTLKEKLWFMTGFPPEKQYLMYVNGNEWLMDDEEWRFVDYGLAKKVEYDESLVCGNPGNRPFWRSHDRESMFHIIVASSKRCLNTYSSDNIII